MTLRGKKIFLKPLNPKKLNEYTEGKATLAELLDLDSVEPELEDVDLSAHRARCEADPKRSYWYVPWIIIRKKDRHGLAMFACEGGPNERHEVMLTVPSGEEFFEEKCEAFELLCEWAAGHDKVYFLRVSLPETSTRAIGFIEGLGFHRIDGDDLYECESAPSAWLPVLICAGLGMGTGLGEALGSMPLGAALGMMGGFFLGSYLDKKNKEARSRIRK